MISYKYKLYVTHRTKYLDRMLREASFVWNHALALQKRYYAFFGKYVSCVDMQKHFRKRIGRNLLGSQTVQELLQRLDTSYRRFFKHMAKRPPKFRRARDFRSIVYKQAGYRLYGNELILNQKYRFKFFYSRPWEGNVKRIILKRSPLGEYYVVIVTDAVASPVRKSHDGASVGIDFGLKTYMTLSDGTTVQSPRFLKESLNEVRRRSRNLSRCRKGSHNRERKRKELDRLHEKITDRRSEWQWELARTLCRKYDRIFIEDLSLLGMGKLWGRKMSDLGHAGFVNKLEYVATRFGVTVHKIDRFYPSSKTCTCGHVNKELKLSDRVWTCPVCGAVHDRDCLAANNILRQGIAELERGARPALA